VGPSYKKRRLSCRFNFARLNYESGNYNRAVLALEKTAETRLIPNLELRYSKKEKSSFYNLLSISYLKLKKFEKAKQWVDRSLQENPAHTPAQSTRQYLKNMSKLNT